MKVDGKFETVPVYALAPVNVLDGVSTPAIEAIKEKVQAHVSLEQDGASMRGAQQALLITESTIKEGESIYVTPTEQPVESPAAKPRSSSKPRTYSSKHNPGDSRVSRNTVESVARPEGTTGASSESLGGVSPNAVQGIEGVGDIGNAGQGSNSLNEGAIRQPDGSGIVPSSSVGIDTGGTTIPNVGSGRGVPARSERVLSDGRPVRRN